MIRNRSIRHRTRQRKKNIVELDITSLLDILVIILVFLLRSYDSSGVVLNVPKGVKLPVSESMTQSGAGVIVQVSTTKIWVDNKVILDMANLPPKPYDQHGKRIVSLFDELVRKKEVVSLLNKNIDEAKKFSGIVNLVVDKTLKYNFVKKLLYTCAEAGYIRYKFIVLGENEV